MFRHPFLKALNTPASISLSTSSIDLGACSFIVIKCLEPTCNDPPLQDFDNNGRITRTHKTASCGQKGCRGNSMIFHCILFSDHSFRRQMQAVVSRHMPSFLHLVRPFVASKDVARTTHGLLDPIDRQSQSRTGHNWSKFHTPNMAIFDPIFQYLNIVFFQQNIEKIWVSYGYPKYGSKYYIKYGKASHIRHQIWVKLRWFFFSSKLCCLKLKYALSVRSPFGRLNFCLWEILFAFPCDKTQLVWYDQRPLRRKSVKGASNRVEWPNNLHHANNGWYPEYCNPDTCRNRPSNEIPWMKKWSWLSLQLGRVAKPRTPTRGAASAPQPSPQISEGSA